MEIREGYKNTEAGVIPEDWGIFELDKLADFASGTTPSREQNDRYFKNGEFHWVKTLDLNNSEIFDTEEKVTQTALVETSSLKLLPIDTVLVAMYGGYNQIGRTGILKINACVNQALTAIKVDKKKLYPYYLINYLNYRIDYWKNIATSSRKDPNITSKDVKNFPILLPSIEEQTAIATALSDADALISSLEKLIAKKRNIKQGTMQELLKPKEGWEVKKLGEICENIGSGKSKTQSKEGKFPIFGSTGIIGWSNSFEYSGHKILIARVGANAGTVNIVDGNYCVSDNTLMVSLKSEIDLKFIYSFLILFQLNKLVFGSGQPLITGGQLKNIEIPLPSSKLEQTRIATILSDMDAEIQALETKLEKYRKIKLGMMQNLLTGKIRLV